MPEFVVCCEGGVTNQAERFPSRQHQAARPAKPETTWAGHNGLSNWRLATCATVDRSGKHRWRSVQQGARGVSLNIRIAAWLFLAHSGLFHAEHVRNREGCSCGFRREVQVVRRAGVSLA